MTHLSLYHIDARLSHVLDTAEHINDALGLRLFQQVVQCYERASTTDAGTAVDDVGARRRLAVIAPVFPVESQHGGGLHGNAMVWPGSKVKVQNSCGLSIL